MFRYDRRSKKHYAGIVVLLVFAFVYLFANLYSDIKKDINTMPADQLYEELLDVPFIGEQRAKAIINNRPYASWAELEEVKGISEDIRLSLEERFNLIPIEITEGGKQ